MQRSAKNSTRPWQDSLNRRYQRTANGITSGLDRKPVDVDSPGVEGRVSFTLHLNTSAATMPSAQQCPSGYGGSCPVGGTPSGRHRQGVPLEASHRSLARNDT